MNEHSPGPSATSSAFSLVDPRSVSDFLDPSKKPNNFVVAEAVNEPTSDHHVINIASLFTSGSNGPINNNDTDSACGNNANENEKTKEEEAEQQKKKENEDRLLTFYQSLVPPHVRVFKRDHPARLVDETDSEYEFRWQFYEYAKAHPLMSPTYFYDIEIKDEMLVPITESLSSTNFTVIEEGDQINGQFDVEPEDISWVEDEVWEIPSVPNTLPLECPKELMQFSEHCLPLYATASLEQLPGLDSRDESLESLLDLASPPSELETDILLAPPSRFLSRSSKSVTFANPIGKYYKIPSCIPPRSRSLPRSIMRESTRYFLSYPPSLQNSVQTLDKNVRFKSFEDLFHRPKSTPSKNLYGSKQERKQLWSRYTFFMRQKGERDGHRYHHEYDNRKRTKKNGKAKNGAIQNKLRWISERLHRGTTAQVDRPSDLGILKAVSTNRSFVKVNKSLQKMLQISHFSKLSLKN